MSSAPVAASRIARLILQDFRTYASLDVAVSRPLAALVGENGAGKTNVLVAISLFIPGRGLRPAEIDGMPALSPTALAGNLRIVGLTPDLDPLFCVPVGDRRRFLDRFVLAVDAE